MVCICEWRPTKTIFPANWLWFLEGLPVKTSTSSDRLPNEKKFFHFNTYVCYIAALCSSSSFSAESQLAVLMHSWRLMTGVLSDHGILMATYPWLSKADGRKAAGSCRSSSCPSAKWTAFCRQRSPRSLFDFFLSIFANELHTALTEYICVPVHGGSSLKSARKFNGIVSSCSLSPEME